MKEISLMPAGPSGPLSQGAYEFQRSLSLTGAFTCFIAWVVGAHALKGEVATAQLPAGLVVTLHSY